MANDRFWRIVLKKFGWRETQAASAHGGEEAFLLFLANALQGSQRHPLKDETSTPGPAGLAQSIAADFST
ncbi:hypothetical protein [Mesorhizobium ventifaucium]|uniref:Uncharacterized protein n=1 Tax=Mesorhizobium ventifaucium TaxID=666020 RepID=A0ABM9E5G2_9HYPH|nr:hypothetical protein [Mesorhizobium ventifaucium]CAH2404360.1 hypothetical protein MES4922_360058 [Mesorhizobium ventifaucium]